MRERLAFSEDVNLSQWFNPALDYVIDLVYHPSRMAYLAHGGCQRFGISRLEITDD